MKRYKVYSLNNKNNEIKYVGQTRQPLKKRFFSHRCSGRLPENDFTIHLIDSFDSAEEMYKLETKLIEELNLVNNGWNKEYGKVIVPKQTSQEGTLNQFYKHSHREEVRQKIGQRSLGNKYAVNSKSRSGLKNKPEHNKAISQKVSKPILCLNNSIIYKNARQAAKELNISHCRISEVVNKKRPHTKGFKFIFATQGSAQETLR